MTTKEFVKEHKKEIIFGGACICLGVSIGKRKYSVNPVEMELVKGLRKFDKDSGLFKDLYEVQNGAKGIRLFTGKPIEVATATELVKKYYGTSNPDVTGIVVFQK